MPTIPSLCMSLFHVDPGQAGLAPATQKHLVPGRYWSSSHSQEGPIGVTYSVSVEPQGPPARAQKVVTISLVQGEGQRLASNCWPGLWAAAGWPAGGSQIFFGEPIMTFDTKLTMALAGCSGSCSANRWHTLSVALPCFRATNPKTL